MLGTLCKAGMVLDLFADGQSEWGVTEVANCLEVPKSGAHSLLSTLVEIGLLERTAGKRYRLGWEVVALSRVVLDTTIMREAAQPMMERLSSRFGAGSFLVVMERGRGLCVEQQMAKGIGPDLIPKVGAYLSTQSPTVQLLIEGRAAKVAAERGEQPMLKAADSEPTDEESAWSVAGPITDAAGDVVAALGLRIDMQRLGGAVAQSLVTKAVEQVSRRLARLELDPTYGRDDAGRPTPTYG